MTVQKITPAVWEDEALVESFAALAHEQWAGWTEWMLEKIDQTHTNGETFRDRWRRQMTTPYADLSEQEKESDRIEARKMIALFAQATAFRLPSAFPPGYYDPDTAA